MDALEDDKLQVTPRTKLRRFPVRGRFDKQTVFAILDKAPVAHIGFQGSSPSVLPMAFWRKDDYVYFHGSAKNRMLSSLSTDRQCCIVATLIDGFVAARAALHHSINYRSVIIYGEAEEVSERDEKLEALKGLIGRFYPGRWEHIRPPSENELTTARVYRVAIVEASAKIRSGFPTPYAEDFGIPVWAGFVPLKVELGEPQMDPNCAPGTPMEDFSHLADIMRSERK